MENLAPAGNREALERADAAGADAVYLGYAAFSARAGAGNFDRQELEEAIRYAHLRHMRVHVTVNTLVKDAELADVTEVLRLLRDLRADAVLVQDLGVLKICREEFPRLPVHASTQMALHNASGVRLLKELGAKRAVMARECDLDEIRKAAAVGLEIEAFCHGALCVSCSGEYFHFRVSLRGFLHPFAVFRRDQHIGLSMNKKDGDLIFFQAVNGPHILQPPSCPDLRPN